MTDLRVAIVGGGPSAASVAKGLRDLGFDGSIVVLADESALPYERPPLSKSYLAGDRSAASLDVMPPGWFLDNDVEVHLGLAASELDLAEHEVVAADGRRFPFSHLVVATGGRPRRLNLDLPESRTFYLRSLADAGELRAALARGPRLAVIGGGFLGAELAATSRRLGLEVTVIETLEFPLQRVLGRELGALFAAIHREEGVRMVTNVTITRVVQGTDITLKLSDGSSVTCDAVAVAVGMVPNLAIVETAGISCRAGILVNEFAETNVPNVLAVGDVTEHYHPLFDQWRRVEHHDHALKHGATAASTIVGRREAYRDPQWFWSDQYRYNLQVTGLLDARDPIVFRGRPEDRSFTAFFLDQGRLIGAAGLNSGNDVRRAGRLISQRREIDPRKLMDPDVDLRRI